jgi:hypothetical protein
LAPLLLRHYNINSFINIFFILLLPLIIFSLRHATLFRHFFFLFFLLLSLFFIISFITLYATRLLFHYCRRRSQLTMNIPRRQPQCRVAAAADAAAAAGAVRRASRRTTITRSPLLILIRQNPTHTYMLMTALFFE